jgi:preprotein translocase SecE subunit
MNIVESITQPAKRLREFFPEAWAELKKVHFPARQETQVATAVVIAAVLFVTFYLGVVDWVLAWFINRALG